MHFEERIEVRRTPAECFAFVDDFANAPRWNELCVALQREGSDAREGGGLVYTYEQGNRTGVMQGQIAERDPPRRLLLEFGDRMFQIEVGFRFDAIPGGTRIEHTLKIEPRSFVTKLMSPLLRGVMRQQASRQARALAQALGG
jgi:carbon monoxide dehydrogenase subunit G